MPKVGSLGLTQQRLSDSKAEPSAAHFLELWRYAKVEVDVLRPVPNSPHGLCGRKATRKTKQKSS